MTDPRAANCREHQLDEFSPPDLGPYAIWVGNGRQSDVIASLGLPNSAHVGFRIVYKVRGEDGPTPPPDNGNLTQALREIRVARSALDTAERLIQEVA